MPLQLFEIHAVVMAWLAVAWRLGELRAEWREPASSRMAAQRTG